MISNDIARSCHFYEELFGPKLYLDNYGNMMLMEELLLHDEVIWKWFTGHDSIPKNNSSDAYFGKKDEGYRRVHSEVRILLLGKVITLIA